MHAVRPAGQPASQSAGRIEVAAKADRKIIISDVGTRQESAVVLYHRGN